MYWTGKERMSNDIMELNDTDLNYIYFERDSDDASKGASAIRFRHA